MASSLFGEKLITLALAAEIAPRVDGKKLYASTMWRWCRNGVSGVRLEYIRVGRRICTSEEALERFFKSLTDKDTEKQSET